MSRFAAALAALALAAGAGAAVFLWQPGLDSLHDDSVSYLVMAQAFSPWHAADAVIRAAFPHEPYPPLFPLLLALAGGAYDWRVAHLVVAVALGASVFLLGLHARNVTASARLGFIAALVYALLPGTWLNAKGILSEYPFMALVFAALAYHAHLGARVPSRRESLVLGSLLAAVLLTRNVGAALLAAIAAAELLRAVRLRDAARLKSLAMVPVIAVVPIALWLWLRPLAGDDAYVASGGVMLQGASDDALAWALASIEANAAAIAGAWLNALLIFWGDPWKPGYLLAVGLGAFGLGATLVRAARGHADGIYCALVLAILLFWPYPGQMYRLAFPLVPLVVVGALWGARELLAPRLGADASERGASYAAVLPLAVCVPAVLFYIVERARMPDPEGAKFGHRKTDIAEFYRMPSGPAAEDYAHRQIEVFGDMTRIRETTAPQARVMWYTPNYVSLLARRRGVPLRRPMNPADLAAQMRATGADFLYLANVHPRDTLRRAGDPLFPWLLARGFTEVVWYRGKEGVEAHAVLLKIDKEKIMNLSQGTR
jgi:4-amino-4-deoxy-L-arabinose transferase-like glycosyltransferase